MMEWGHSLQGHRDAFVWFTESQFQSVIKDGIVPEWFHGITSRKTSEELLMSKLPGYFLIRVSESRIGYTLSYRAEDRCRHFMIDALEDGHYSIVGENRRHRFLQDLVDFHRRTPIMPFSEVLTVACGQTSNDKTDYAEILFPQGHLDHNTSLPPSNSLHPSISQPVSQEDTPPALPHRPNNLRNSAVQSPNRLYPCLGEEFPHITSPVPATPVPMARKKYTTCNSPSNQLPTAAGSPVIPPKQNHACIRTASPPEPRYRPAASEHPSSSNIHSVKSQEAKPSIVTNLKNLKKKFQRKTSISEEFIYAEITDSSGNTEHEYHKITGEQIFSGPPLSYTCPDGILTDGGLPQEYLPPPPFAPGY